MTVRRLYVPELPEEGGAVALDEAASRHVRVLRLREGDEVVLFDGSGRSSEARIESLGPELICMAQAPLQSQVEQVRLVLILAVPKGSKLDDCVRMATELGADEISLMLTERTVPRWDAERTRGRIERLSRIAAEAAAQCERSDVPLVHPPQSYETLLQRVPPEASCVLFGARADAPFRVNGTPDQVWCAIGPEGGFTEAEVEAFSAAGFSVASLGTRVLRVDTAAAAALAVVRDQLERRLQAR